MPKSNSQKLKRHPARRKSQPTRYRVVWDDSCFPLVGKVFSKVQIQRAWQQGLFQARMEFVLQCDRKQLTRHTLNPSGELTQVAGRLKPVRELDAESE